MKFRDFKIYEASVASAVGYDDDDVESYIYHFPSCL